MKLKHLPNIVTFIRLLGVPVLVALLYVVEQSDFRWIAVFFLLLALTDILDGWLARKLDAVSDVGKLLDPLVDKLLILAPLIALVGMRSEVTGDPWVPAWFVILVLAREMWVTGLRGLAATYSVIVAASELGKIKTVFQVGAVFFLLLHQEKLFRMSDGWMTGQYLGIQCLLTSIIVGYWGGIEYTMQVFKAVKCSKQKGSNEKSILSRRAIQ